MGVGAAVVALDLGLFGAAGTLFGLGSANIWNPVGWGLLAISLITGIFGYRKKREMEEKLRTAKAKAHSKLLNAVNKTQDDINRAMDTYVNKILASVQTEHIEVMRRYASYAKKHLTQVDDLTSFLFSLDNEMKKLKFESMLTRLIGEESIKVLVVAEDNSTITLRLNAAVDSNGRIQRILSRVEEKQVFLECEAHV
jgi:KaiC/GvpD/RAD55 family RecA-like ATPase